METEEKLKVEVTPTSTLAPPPVDGEKKERKISRFKVSVVTEPDLSKLAVPEKKKSECEEQQQTGDVASVINDAYKSLEKVVDSCYSIKPGWFC